MRGTAWLRLQIAISKASNPDPGHEIVGNDVVDAATKDATTQEEDPTEITYKSVCTYIRSVIKDTPSHE